MMLLNFLISVVGLSVKSTGLVLVLSKLALHLVDEIDDVFRLSDGPVHPGLDHPYMIEGVLVLLKACLALMLRMEVFLSGCYIQFLRIVAMR